MAAHRCPRQVEFIDEPPKSGSGKILWCVLQERKQVRITKAEGTSGRDTGDTRRGRGGPAGHRGALQLYRPEPHGYADTEPISVESRWVWFHQHDPESYPTWIAEVDAEIVG